MANKQNFVIKDRVTFKVISKKSTIDKKINNLQNQKESKKDQ